jgi:lipopolysaccharide exporter
LMQALSIYAMFYSLSFNAGDIYKATGRPDILNKLSVIELIFIIPLLWFASGYGVLYVALAQIIGSSFLAVVKFAVISRLISLRMLDILSAIRPAAIGTIVMAVSVFGLQILVREFSTLPQLLILTLSGGLVYVATIWLTNREVVNQGVNLLRNILIKKPVQSEL